MKTHIKHLACLALLSITHFIAMGQIQIFRNQPEDRLRTSIVRMIDDEHYIISKTDNPSSFSYVDLGTMHEYRTDLPINVFINDFEILDSIVLFCGDNSGTVAYTGWFNVNDLIAGNGFIYLTDHAINSNQRLYTLKKLDAYNIGTEYHIATIGEAYSSGSYKRVLSDIAINIATNSIVACNHRVHTNLPETFSDIITTNNYVLTIGTDEAHARTYTRIYNKPTVAGSNYLPPILSFIYHLTDTAFVNSMYGTVAYATHVSNNIAATLTPYKDACLIVSVINCALSSSAPPIDRFAVNLLPTFPITFKILDFKYNPHINSFVILTQDYNGDNMFVIPYTIGTVAPYINVFRFPNLLFSIDYDPFSSLMIISGATYSSYFSRMAIFNCFNCTSPSCAQLLSAFTSPYPNNHFSDLYSFGLINIPQGTTLIPILTTPIDIISICE